jgi:diguanylate cyclase (GGDEF)-like protein
MTSSYVSRRVPRAKQREALDAIRGREHFAVLAGMPSAELVGEPLSRGDLANIADACEAAVAGEPASFCGPLAGRDGVERFVECEVEPLRDPEGQVTGAILLTWDLTEHKRSEALIERLSLRDSLTDLANRALLNDRLTVALAQADRSGSEVVVAIYDLDRFAATNEALGHARADKLLQAVGERLRTNVRAADTVARWGGDEFAVVMPNVRSEGVLGLSQRVAGCLAEPFHLDGTEVWVTAGAGIACYPDDGADAGELLERAESALRAAKRQGPAGVAFYSPELSARGEERIALTSELHRALQEGQLRVYYQPQIDLAGPTLCGCEALVRWQHPTRGLVSPGDFIPLAEESGLILPLGEWLLGEACEQAARWSRQGVDLRMAVNLSPRQFQQRDLSAMVAQALVRSGLPAGRLELELTETVIADPRMAAATLREISGLGVSLALDDFGTGYSSLSLLRGLPIDRLKIDRSFVDGLEDDPDSAAIARAVIELGRSLDLRVVGEGVENAAQLAFLRAQGCDEVQGYFFGRPVPADLFELRPSFEVAVDRAAAGERGDPAGVAV